MFLPLKSTIIGTFEYVKVLNIKIDSDLHGQAEKYFIWTIIEVKSLPLIQSAWSLEHWLKQAGSSEQLDTHSMNRFSQFSKQSGSGVLCFRFCRYNNTIKLTGNFEISGNRKNFPSVKIFLGKAFLLVIIWVRFLIEYNKLKWTLENEVIWKEI